MRARFHARLEGVRFGESTGLVITQMQQMQGEREGELWGVCRAKLTLAKSGCAAKEGKGMQRQPAQATKSIEPHAGCVPQANISAFKIQQKYNNRFPVHLNTAIWAQYGWLSSQSVGCASGPDLTQTGFLPMACLNPLKCATAATASKV